MISALVYLAKNYTELANDFDLHSVERVVGYIQFTAGGGFTNTLDAAVLCYSVPSDVVSTCFGGAYACSVACDVFERVGEGLVQRRLADHEVTVIDNRTIGLRTMPVHHRTFAARCASPDQRACRRYR